jgi:hypothetical protein
MLREISGRIRKTLDMCNDKAAKWNVYQELNTFAQESWMFRSKQTSIRTVYREALKDPVNFRRILDRARNREYNLLKGDSELPVSAAERRYYRKRDMEVPPLF